MKRKTIDVCVRGIAEKDYVHVKAYMDEIHERLMSSIHDYCNKSFRFYRITKDLGVRLLPYTNEGGKVNDDLYLAVLTCEVEEGVTWLERIKSYI